jgi:beta-lactam-binding protein with PASTA domain
VITQAYHPSIPAGSIAGQSPRAGANVTPGSAVSLVVSLGPPAVVPDLVNLPQAEAEAAITAAGLTLGLVTQEHHPTIPAGHVTAQSPAVGTTVAAGTVVTLVLSLGPEPLEEVLVPDVLGLPQPDAEALILAAGLNIGTVTQLYSTTADPGTVIGQSPAAEELALEGDPVNLEVAVDVIPVESLEDLQRIGYDPAFPLDARYLLVQDIDAAETFEWNEGAGFIPIGDAAAPFTGIFDGAGHVILNLYIHRPVENFVGLFGALGSGGVECDSGRVYDLHLLSAEVTGARFVGALSGYAPAGSIQDCTVDAAVYGQKHTAPLAGYLEPTDGECSLQSPDSKL